MSEVASKPVSVRASFPALEQRVHGRPLVYLDSASTSLRPAAVIDAVASTMASVGSAGRGVHALASRATRIEQETRAVVQRFLRASNPDEIVFTRGATEGLNMLAAGLARTFVRAGDEVLITALEHHSNRLPWQRLAHSVGARLIVAPCDVHGDLDLEATERAITSRTRVIAVAHVANATGALTPVERLASLARSRGVRVIVDGAQAVAHLPVDVRALGCDAYVASGHKMFGPEHTGFVWAKADVWRDVAPLLVGGGMVADVDDEGFTMATGPARFEAGTGHASGLAGLSAAIHFIEQHRAEGARIASLLHRLVETLRSEPGVRLIGEPRRRTGLVSFAVEGAHAHDIGSWLDACGIAVRVGHLCALPYLRHFGVEAVIRASLSIHTTDADIDALLAGLRDARACLGAGHVAPPHSIDGRRA